MHKTLNVSITQVIPFSLFLSCFSFDYCMNLLRSEINFSHQKKLRVRLVFEKCVPVLIFEVVLVGEATLHTFSFDSVTLHTSVWCCGVTALRACARTHARTYADTRSDNPILNIALWNQSLPSYSRLALSKHSLSEAMHSVRWWYYYWKHFWNSFSWIPFCNVVAFCWMSELLANLSPFSVSFKFDSSQKSLRGFKSGE